MKSSPVAVRLRRHTRSLPHGYYAPKVKRLWAFLALRHDDPRGTNVLGLEKFGYDLGMASLN